MSAGTFSPNVAFYEAGGCKILVTSDGFGSLALLGELRINELQTVDVKTAFLAEFRHFRTTSRNRVFPVCVNISFIVKLSPAHPAGVRARTSSGAGRVANPLKVPNLWGQRVPNRSAVARGDD